MMLATVAAILCGVATIAYIWNNRETGEPLAAGTAAKPPLTPSVKAAAATMLPDENLPLAKDKSLSADGVVDFESLDVD